MKQDFEIFEGGKSIAEKQEAEAGFDALMGGFDDEVTRAQTIFLLALRESGAVFQKYMAATRPLKKAIRLRTSWSR